MLFAARQTNKKQQKTDSHSECKDPSALQRFLPQSTTPRYREIDTSETPNYDDIYDILMRRGSPNGLSDRLKNRTKSEIQEAIQMYWKVYVVCVFFSSFLVFEKVLFGYETKGCDHLSVGRHEKGPSRMASQRRRSAQTTVEKTTPPRVLCVLGVVLDECLICVRFVSLVVKVFRVLRNLYVFLSKIA